MSKEKRVFSRVKLPADASLIFKKKTYPVKLRNLSLQGATVTTDAKIGLARGNPCRLRINAQQADRTLDLDALAMYYDDDKIGFQFCENRQSTVKQLHKIIRSNFENSEA